MATPLATAFVRIRPDTSGFEREAKTGLDKAGRGLAEQGKRHGHLFGATFARASAGPLRAVGGIFTQSLAGIGGAFAAVGAVKVFSGFISDARESNKIAAITAAAIKSTGGAAKVSAKQVGDLATAISNKTGKDDEAIQSGENLLLTFTNIRNETGKGNDIFNRASSAIVDMTAALNNGAVTSSGLKASSIQLGKALNDPIKGVTALRKVGVSFTEQQTEQIKKLVESGDTLSAQKIILRELGKEFGGAAKASSNPMERLRVIVGNLGEQIGNKLIPYLDTAAKFIGDKIVPAVMRFIDGMKTGEGAGGQFVEAIGHIRDAVIVVAGYIQRDLLPVLGTVANIVKDDVIPVIAGLVKWITKNKEIIPALGIALAVVLVPAFVAWAVAAGSAAIATIAAAAPVIALVAVIAGAAFLIIKHWKAISGAFKAAFNWVKDNWPLLLGILTGPFGLAVVEIIKHRDAIWDAFKGLLKWFRDRWSTVYGFLTSVFEEAKFTIQTIALDIAKGFLNALSMIVNAAARIPGPLGSPFRKAKEHIDNAKESVKNLQDTINRAHGKKVTVTVEEKMKNKLRLQAIASAHGAELIVSGKPVYYAAGGFVNGPGGIDKVPAMLTHGEYVIKASRARQLGTRFLDLLNNAKSIGGDPGAAVLRFASGGSVGAAQSFVRAQQGEQYILGGAGPNTWDCSGITGAVFALLRGLAFGHGQRYFTTQSSFGGLGFRRGLGAYTIGVSPGAGHMVGNIGGVSFEAARPGVPLRVGNATSVKSMAQQWFLASLGGGGFTSAEIRQVMANLGVKFGVRAGGQLTSFDRGTSWVPQTGLYGLHRGEAVIPAKYNRPGGATVVNITINTGGVVGMTKMDLENQFVSVLNKVAGQGRITTAVRLAS